MAFVPLVNWGPVIPFLSPPQQNASTPVAPPGPTLPVGGPDSAASSSIIILINNTGCFIPHGHYLIN
jgi:hypothetical protein